MLYWLSLARLSCSTLPALVTRMRSFPSSSLFQRCSSVVPAVLQRCKPSNVATCNVLHCVGTSCTALQQVALRGPHRSGTHTQAGELEMEAHALGSAGGAILSVKRYPYSLNTYPDAVTQIT